MTPEIRLLQNDLHPLTGSARDYDPLLDGIGDARVVLLGEASHGTHEFYEERARITRRLVEEKGFTLLALEADWPEAERLHGFVTGRGRDRTAAHALSAFHRFPLWMWRNRPMAAFLGWAKDWNAGRSEQLGIYGLDLYSLHASMDAVVRYLERTDPEAAGRARERYACFDHFDQDPQVYGYTAGQAGAEACEKAVVEQLLEMLSRPRQPGEARDAAEERFFAEQNARVVRNAEAYFRAMFRGRISSWNLRDRHMMEMLQALLSHRPGGKMVVWAHNSHLGDARATSMGERGELNLGQLVREEYGDESRLIGFTTYHGTVTAASHWGEEGQPMQVRPALPESYEALFHELKPQRFMLDFREPGGAVEALARPRLERAIGVIYRPYTERASHYMEAELPAQFDAVIHIDKTRAVEPLPAKAVSAQGEVPETFPSSY